MDKYGGGDRSRMAVWVNGALTTGSNSVVSALDHGLTAGDGVFETIKTLDGVPFALTRHLDRLARSAKGMGLPAVEPGNLRDGCRAVLSANDPIDNGRLRITVTGGPAPLGSERGTQGPTVVIAVDPNPVRSRTTTAVTVEWTRNERSATAGLKSTSYGENVVALATATSFGATEALMANTMGRLCEGTGANVFLAMNGQLFTPPLSSGCLAGITRALVLEWVGAVELDLPFSALAVADEVFLTSTVRDVQAVTLLDGRQLPVGPLTANAMRIFEARSISDVDP
ncbi:aminodeoxychorismate lyase [Nocardia sp. NPDC005978]|uniref:aminotransferase class IV n=1 Tax=Nocardia sp. NPDC005978 TaxID=3156725 RepID=UPI0033B2A65C